MGRINIAAFLIRHQGAELFNTKGENFGVFAILRDFDTTKGLWRGKDDPREVAKQPFKGAKPPPLLPMAQDGPRKVAKHQAKRVGSLFQEPRRG